MFFGGDPFEHFAGAGMGGGMGGRAPRGEVDNEEFYNILGVAKDANEGEIKKAYRKVGGLTRGLVVGGQGWVGVGWMEGVCVASPFPPNSVCSRRPPSPPHHTTTTHSSP